MQRDYNAEERVFAFEGRLWCVTADLAVVLRQDLRPQLGPAYHPPAGEGNIHELTDAQLQQLVQAWSLTLHRQPLEVVFGNRWRVVREGREICIDMRRFGPLLSGRVVELAKTGEGGPDLVIVSTPGSPRGVVAIFSTLAN